MIRLYLHQEMLTETHISINFQGWKQYLSPDCSLFSTLGYSARTFMCVCLNATAIFLYRHNQFTLEKKRNLETEINIRKKQSGFYSFRVNLLRPAECYLGIISINTWRKAGACKKVQTNKRKRNWQGKSNSSLQKNHRAKSKKIWELSSSGLLKDHNFEAKRDHLGTKE